MRQLPGLSVLRSFSGKPDRGTLDSKKALNVAKKSPQPWTSHHIRLFAGDYEAMGVLYPKLGAAVAIRTIVNQHIRAVREATTPLDLDLPDVDLAALMEDQE